MSDSNDFDLQNFLPYLLNQAAEESSLAFQKVYKERYGMLRTEWRVLFHLGIYGRLTAKDICERASIHKTKISRAVQRLEDRQFLNRTRRDNDRRSEFLELTKAGQSAYRDLRQTAEDYDRKLVADFEPKDVEMLRRMLVKLSDRDR